MILFNLEKQAGRMNLKENLGSIEESVNESIEIKPPVKLLSFGKRHTVVGPQGLFHGRKLQIPQPTQQIPPAVQAILNKK